MEIENLILSGALEPAGIDAETGEMLYVFSKDLKNINPDLYKAVSDSIYWSSVKLWELGFVNMDMTEENPLVSLTPNAFDEDKINTLLDDDLKFALKEMKRNLLNK